MKISVVLAIAFLLLAYCSALAEDVNEQDQYLALVEKRNQLLGKQESFLDDGDYQAD